MQAVRFRVDLSSRCSIGPGKIELLEAIDRHGSIRQAAIDLGMSYRHAWLLIDDLNHSFTEPVTRTSVGGSSGGGAKLTDLGADLIRRYRRAGRRIESFARAEFEQLARKVREQTAGRRELGRRRLAKRKIATRQRPV
jgi:molybdate transport system regulatory protein